MTNYITSNPELEYLSPGRTMEIVLEAINEIIPYELAVILNLEDEGSLKVKFAKGSLINEKLKSFEILLENRPDIREVMNKGSVKLVEETAVDDHQDTYEDVLDLPTGHSCMLVPLSINGNPLGLMTLDHRQCDMFTPQRVNIAGTLSKLISLALAQANRTDSLISEKETLIFERNSLIGDISTIIEGLVGRSPVWLQIIEKIKLVAPTESHVMILGETGTGKEQVAKAIHALSNKSSNPFITLNCSAINLNLAESELFGHEKGAFTGAVSVRRGRFELADGGILFLDEIGDLPLEIQPKLLRAIQEGTFERLGSENSIKANVRIICATNLNLEQKVKEGKFREDLFYRLNVFPVILPPLRERGDDIEILTNYFLDKLAVKFKKGKISLTNEAMKSLRSNTWQGNVRELQNTLERAVILSKGGVIKSSHLLFEGVIQPEIKQTKEKLESYHEESKKIIIRALKLAEGKIYGAGGAAEILKLKPTTLQSKIKKLGIKLNSSILK